MASEHDLISRGDTMLDHIKEWAPFVGALVAMIAGWWAWRTSLLKALSDRLAAVESREDARIKEAALAQVRVAELTAELMVERGQRKLAEAREAHERAEKIKWQTRWDERRERQRHDSQRPAGGGLAEDTSDADALDDLAADRSDTSGLIHVPPGGMPK